MRLQTAIEEIPPVNPAVNFEKIPKPPAVVSSRTKRFKESRVIELAQLASRELDAFDADWGRLQRERFTLEELLARGGVAALLKPFAAERLRPIAKAVEELTEEIGGDGQVALTYQCGGLIPDYLTVRSLADRLEVARKTQSNAVKS